MSSILLIVIGILLICAIIGWKKGIIRIVLSLAATILTILVTLFLAPILVQTLKNNTSIDEKLEKVIENALDKNDNIDNAVDDTVTQQSSEYIASNGEISTYVEKVLTALNLPDSMKKSLSRDLTEEEVENISVIDSTTVKEAILDVIAKRLSDVVCTILIYIIVFVIIIIIMRIVIGVSGLISKLPVIHEANKIGGLAVGLIEGLLVVWIMFLVITLYSSNEWAGNALTDINNNELLKLMYNNNPILNSVFHNL